jgi:hypothetical protein
MAFPPHATNIKLGMTEIVAEKDERNPTLPTAVEPTLTSKNAALGWIPGVGVRLWVL